MPVIYKLYWKVFCDKDSSVIEDPDTIELIDDINKITMIKKVMVSGVLEWWDGDDGVVLYLDLNEDLSKISKAWLDTLSFTKTYHRGQIIKSIFQI